MANYLEFTPNVTWAKVRVGYEESYDSATKVNTLTITSIEVMSTKYKADYYVDGTLKVNDTAVFTSKSSSGNVSVSVRVSTSDEPVWYTIKKNGEPVTATIQIEGSETATIELTGNNFQRFAFYTSDGEDGNGWGVNQSQTIDLTGEEEPEEPVAAWDERSFWLGVSLGLAGKGLPPIKTAEPVEPVAYLYGHIAKEGETVTHPNINGVDYVGAVLPKLPEWDRAAYPYAFIHYGFTNEKYTIHVLNEKCHYRDWPAGRCGVLVSNASTRCSYALTDGEWVWEGEAIYTTAVTRGNDGTTVGEIVWSNYDIRNETEQTLYLAAIDPIPVYE